MFQQQLRRRLRHVDAFLASLFATFCVLFLYSSTLTTSHASFEFVDDNFDVLEERKNVQRSGLLNLTNFRRFFLLARDPEVRAEKLRKEFSRHKDVVQGNFDEAYTMLSYKHIMGLQWVNQQCKTNNQQRLLILKMDDDILVDFDQLFQKLKSLPDSDLARKLFGFKHFEMPIKRVGKWAVGKDGFGASDVYPDFLSGWAYVCSTTTAKLLVDAALRSSEVFWIDDVWVTGFLARSVGIELEPLNPYYTVYVEHLRCCVEAEDVVCEFIVGPSDGDVKLMVDFARKVAKCGDKKFGKDRCVRRKFPDSVVRDCPIKNPLFLPDSIAVVGEIF